ncbi:uncharacterized protein LOC126371525 [Pectinophora gossypiella]|uniref:uncharacterized protein LOC126371525 n=1 Tax=Pectinophora gossypiella TaxID=13191 RepID=UPI00214F4E4E|nr:uncharacterized protein LOC126371525 [Pectinophora gossypiella]
MELFYCVVFFTLFVAGSSEYIFTPAYSCKNNSSECLKDSIQAALPSFVKGDPSLGTEPLDPFIIRKLSLKLPGNLDLEFRQGSSKGLKKCVIDSARMVKDTLDLQFHCSLVIKGKYKSSGRLLMFAIDGDGDSTIKCKNIKIQFLAKLGSAVQDDGKRHLEIRAFKSYHSFEGQVFYRMTNLIKGNPQISNLIVDFMNQNWRMVAQEFGKPIVDFGISCILKNVKQLFKAVTQEQLIGITNVFDTES